MSNFMKFPSLTYKNMSRIIIGALLLTCFIARPIYALIPATDYTDIGFDTTSSVSNTTSAAKDIKREVKDTFLAKLSITIANMFLQKLVNGAIRWANSGFEGNPFYIQNPSLFKSNIVYQQATLFADSLKRKYRQWLQSSNIAIVRSAKCPSFEHRRTVKI